MASPRYQQSRDYPPQFGGGGSYRQGDSVADIIMRTGQARADAAYRSAGTWDSAIDDISHNLTGALTQYGQMNDEKQVQDAILAARGGAPSRPGMDMDVNGDPRATPAQAGPDINAILSSLPPELRGRAMKGIQDTQASVAAVQKNRLEIEQLQGQIKERERKGQQDVADHWGTTAFNLKPFLDGQDGGIGAAVVAMSLSKDVPGTERLAPFVKQAAAALEEAKASGDPAQIQAVADSFRQQAGPMLDQGLIGLSPEKRKALIDAQNAENPAGVALPDNGLVNPRTGQKIAEGPGKQTNLQHVETDKGIQTFDPKTGQLGPVIAKGKPTGMGGMNGLYADVDPKAIAEAIKRGEQPPVLTDLGRPVGAAVSSELAKGGYNLAKAATDWKATQKHIATLNGSQQLRLNQAVNALPDLLDSVDSLASQWKGGRFPALNKANLALAKGGAYGSDVASVANKLDAQIADVNADLAVVYMGGNSPTDHGLSLASKSLAGDWDEKVLHDMVKMAKGNVTIRRNSIMNTGVAGASAGNPYAPPPAGGPPAPPAGGGAEPTATGPNGQKLVLRNGQWVPVQ